LSQKGVELRIKEMIYLPGGEKKADWDVGIAVDAIRIAKFVDSIILVSGDGDFMPLVEYLKNQGNIVEIAGFSRNTSIKLKELADFFYDLDEIKNYILIKK
ncbi:MAG: NYN domain-containing protein, partial [Patescibacteria group bacterium]|nr:NYN domain-containing protein [Patescibacteria group bacterium]